MTLSMARSFLKKLNKYKLYYLLILPGILWYIIFYYLPMYGVVIAFKDVSPFESIPQMLASDWVGLKHFKRFFNSYYFGTLMGNTLTIGTYRILTGPPLAVLFALLINEVRNQKFKRVVQTISYMPHFISMVVMASLCSMLTNVESGLINHVIEFFGGKPINFMGDSRYFRGVLIVSDVWKSLGWSTIIYLAAISGVNPELYEAATVDGCNRFRQAIHVTIPGILPTISIMLVLSVTSFINAGFDQIFLMYSPRVYDVADIIDTYVYREGISNLNYSYSTAVGLFKSIISAVLMLGTNAIVRAMGQQGIW